MRQYWLCPILIGLSVSSVTHLFAIGSALLKTDADGRERVIAFESRQLKAAEKNYPVHDKGLLAMKYALVKFRVHLLGSKPFVIEGTAKLFIDRVFGQHDLPVAVVSDRDPRFTGIFWKSIFKVLGTRLDMSTADHPQTDRQTERITRVINDNLRSVCADTPTRWSSMLPVVEFALNNAVHVSTGYTPFYVNGITHLRVPLTLPICGSGLGGREVADRLADISPATVQKQVSEFSQRD